MGHYLDIELLPDPEFPVHQLLAALYANLHRALVEQRSSQIAVSFPGYSYSPPSLGRSIRLIGPGVALALLMADDWLRGMRDHVSAGNVAEVPAHAAARSLRRVQAKSNPERLRRRQMLRHGLTALEAQARVPDSAAENLCLPFVQLGSTSTGQSFRLYLSLGPEQSTVKVGAFNTYGLSATATIPWF
ncbi:MAG: type I-F CRISPR-associated endoribonuclease Cas6/Csy4 [Acidithiobacillus ferriphilus]|uniref:type I-F CRISPR-associated endoribonuclease Cas6/Csy4 n=1 Tax=Acidithiobacillus ferriphilus TaxID=1689834 RepID=UPI00242ADB76|nr:type I-F CRISPR-associated endoribonuclease Cas6/Csy4 [Acidithiobacillus ferriphilus]MBW9247730.1 type I-F CRISPR-associated endoribonuclease Cas6/Csy4 [Acidithiobacillus ferriphilus]MBW9254859.1 type I-F CRISPR-associated endoribonuclease Cas6/Csy4 [Acidithiobacillus ferriphilus]